MGKKGLISQAVLLSLIHHISLNLENEPKIKLEWMQEGLLTLNPLDPSIHGLVNQIIIPAQSRLEEILRKGGLKDDEISRKARMIFLIINGLL